MKNHKTLIIKTGYSEILEGRNNSRTVSLGDVLRTTPLLVLYPKDSITWVTDLAAFPLLEGNTRIHKVLPYDFTTSLQLTAEEFDRVINLEKIPGICALADRIRARRSRYGFTFNSQSGEAEAFDKAYEVLAVSCDPQAKKQNKRPSQELLFEMVGAKWNGERYSLGYQPSGIEQYDVALNTQVGEKWPSKAWPLLNWDVLEEVLVKQGYRVTRQDELKGGKRVNRFNTLPAYMDWLYSSRLLVSNDSLGLHLGLAMDKKVLGLFGPTPSSEVHFYGQGEAILPTIDCAHHPCFREKCLIDHNCMETINPEQVLDKIREYTS